MARILLIDDDDAVRRVLSRTLDHFGHTVIEARDGDEGLELYSQVHPDLLITDLVMPKKGGLEVLAELRKKNLPLKAIAISGGGRYYGADNLDQAKALGAAHVLAKPFSRDALMQAVNELLSTGAKSRGLPPEPPAPWVA